MSCIPTLVGRSFVRDDSLEPSVSECGMRPAIHSSILRWNVCENHTDSRFRPTERKHRSDSVEGRGFQGAVNSKDARQLHPLPDSGGPGSLDAIVYFSSDPVQHRNGLQEDRLRPLLQPEQNPRGKFGTVESDQMRRPRGRRSSSSRSASGPAHFPGIDGFDRRLRRISSLADGHGSVSSPSLHAHITGKLRIGRLFRREFDLGYVQVRPHKPMDSSSSTAL